MTWSLSRRDLLLGAAGAAGALTLGGLPAFADNHSDLIAAAKKEGGLNTIALPPDWANYGEMMSSFSAKYGIKINNASPNASSAQELQAIKATRGQDRAIDVVDIGNSFALVGMREGLFQPYKVATWDSIPNNMKDKDGHWYADYFGVVSFGVNKNIVKNVPKTWKDLLKPEYKNMVALNGNPLGAGAAFGGVWAASLANGGSLDDMLPGVKFFGELAKAGNFIPVGVTPATVESGQTPISIQWDYLNLGYRDQFAAKAPLEVVIPEDGVFGNYYVQAISKFAAHPNAAKLWMEHVYSDEGQLIYLKGYAHPARFNDLVKNNKVPKELADKLPPAKYYENVQFPTEEQQKKATEVLQNNWQDMVSN